MTHGRVPPAPLTGHRGERPIDVGPGPWPPPPLDVATVAAAVDEGRALAARAARQGAGHVLLRALDLPEPARVARLAAWVAGRRGAGEPAGPLSAVRRYGDGQLAVCLGVVLGAGEQGMTCACLNEAARVAGELAVEHEPQLRDRVG